MDPQDTIIVTQSRVSCDGGGSQGHPNVYLKIGASGETVCPYCSRRYALAEKTGAAKAGAEPGS